VFSTDEVGAGNPDMGPLLSHYPEFWEEEAAPFFEGLFAATGLDFRVRELILIALVSMRGWEAGVRFHAKKALDAGIDPDELRGAALATVGVGGVASAAQGIKWIDSYLQEREAQLGSGPSD
jgi:AhpD family alkylhydroperoxidase